MACTRILNDRTQSTESRVLAYNHRGDAYAYFALLNRALADYNEAIRLDPRFAASYWRRAKLYAKKDTDRALTDFDQAISLDPKFIDAYKDRAEAYLKTKEYDRAIADYTEAIKLDPNSGRALFGRGNAYYAKGDYNGAIADYDAAKLKRKFYDEESDRVDSALAKANTLRRRSEFGKKYGVKTWASIQDLKINPFRFKDEVVGVRASFKQMLSERDALFDDLLVAVNENTDFKRAGQQFVLAVKVTGFMSEKSTAGPRIPSGACVGFQECKKRNCLDFFDR